MINFRFHLVSLIAVFLALTIGVVMGSAVIDRAIVDGLRTRIDQVERNADARRDENDRLKSDLERKNAYIASTAPYAVTDRLTNAPVLVFAWRGVDDQIVRDQVTLLGQSGAKVNGVVWLEPTWDLQGDRFTQLETALGVSAKTNTELWTTTWTRLAGRLASGPGGNTPEVFTVLSDAGFLTFEPIGDNVATSTPAQYAPNGVAVEVITGSTAAPAAALVLVRQVDALVDARIATVVGEVYKESGKKPPARGAVIQPVRDDAAAAARVSTVDNIDLAEGQVAAVLALAAAPSGRYGNFGYGPGTKPVPEWTQP